MSDFIFSVKLEREINNQRIINIDFDKNQIILENSKVINFKVKKDQTEIWGNNMEDDNIFYKCSSPKTLILVSEPVQKKEKLTKDEQEALIDCYHKVIKLEKKIV